MRFIFLLLLSFGFQFVAIGAKPNGNLNNNNLNSDTSTVNNLNKQCWSLRRTDPSSAITIGKKSLALAQKIGYSEGVAQVLNFLGNCYVRLDDQRTASSYFFKALSFSDSLSINLEKGYALNNIAGAMIRQQEYQQALIYAKEALKLQIQNNDKKGIAYAWMQVSDTYYYLQQYDSLMIGAQNGLKIFKEIGMAEHTMVALKNIGRAWEGKGQYEKAITCFMEIINSRVSTKETISDVYIDLIKVYNLLKQPDKAIYWSNKWISERGVSELILSNLSDSYAIKKNWKEAYRNSQLSKLIKDSLLKQERFRQIKNLQILYETQETKKENDDLKEQISVKDVLMKSSILIIILIILVVLILLSKRNQQVRMLKILNQKNEEIGSQRDHLTELNQTKNKLFSIIAHDLRAPIGNISVLLDLLTENESDFTKEELVDNLKMLSDSSKATFKLLENLLTWSMAQRGELIFKPLPNDMFKLVKLNIDLFAANAKSKNILILNELNAEFTCTFDYEMINTVLRNLINNAIKFTQEGGNVTISGTKINDQIEISVKDTGIGMDIKTKNSLFGTELKQNRKDGTMGEKGTGLGLILCKEFIAKHNGRIWVESEIGAGSTFKFSLPSQQTFE
ncbi:MAG: ATP-binding protein [Mariniphaga sp.]